MSSLKQYRLQNKIISLDTYRLKLYKSLLLACDSNAVKAVFLKVPIVRNRSVYDESFEFFYGGFHSILGLFTPYKEKFLFAMENHYDSEPGVNRVTITHPVIKESDVMKHNLCNTGNTDSLLFRVFISLCDKAEDHLQSAMEEFYAGYFITGKNRYNIVTRIVFYFHCDPIDGKFFKVLYHIFLYIDTLRKAILLLKEGCSP